MGPLLTVWIHRVPLKVPWNSMALDGTAMDTGGACGAAVIVLSRQAQVRGLLLEPVRGFGRVRWYG